MRSYGLTLWPFLQSLGQLYKTYDHEIAEDFFANADLVQFFGVSDQFTAAKASEYLGRVDLTELDSPPSQKTWGDMTWDERFSDPNAVLDYLKYGDGIHGETDADKADHRKYQAELNKRMQEYQHQMRLHGSQRITPDEVRQLTTKDGEGLAPAQIVFIKSKPYLLGLRGWWEQKKKETAKSAPEIRTAVTSPIDVDSLPPRVWVGVGLVGLGIVFALVEAIATGAKTITFEGGGAVMLLGFAVTFWPKIRGLFPR